VPPPPYPLWIVENYDIMNCAAHIGAKLFPTVSRRSTYAVNENVSPEDRFFFEDLGFIPSGSPGGWEGDLPPPIASLLIRLALSLPYSTSSSHEATVGHFFLGWFRTQDLPSADRGTRRSSADSVRLHSGLPRLHAEAAESVFLRTNTGHCVLFSFPFSALDTELSS